MSLVLREIWIYPIKSLGGIPLSSSQVTEKGLKYDRRYMLVTEKNVFMTQREFPQMALFRTEIVNEDLIIRWKTDVLTISLIPDTIGKSLTTNVFDDTVLVVQTKNEYDQWFSKRIGTSCNLVFFPEKNARPIDPNYQIKDENVSLADRYPFLIIGEESLNNLNLKLSSPVPMNRFRPNMVFSGGEPFEEDRWRNFRIGENRFVGVKPCARCAIPTVNQDTGEKGKEPLVTLSKYRRGENGKVYFGQNVVAQDHTKISVGQKIQIESYSD